jgi:hypothetical protein
MRTLPLLCLIALLAGGAASASRASDQGCVATLTFDTFDVLTDTDPNPPFARPDLWTVHAYIRVNGILGSGSETKWGRFSGDSGAHFTVPNGTMLDHVVVGPSGGDVVVDVHTGHAGTRVKEADPKSGRQGIAPSDQQPFGGKSTIPGCQPGTYTFPFDVSVPARPGGDPNEHDGLVRATFELTLS